MVWMGEIQNCITQQDQKLFMFALKNSRQRLVSGLNYNAFPHPLPELRLRRPELLPIATDYKGAFLFSLLIFLNT